jgi:hypothetical protein
VLHGVLGDLADVVVTLLHTETGETKRRLSSTSVLLGQVDRELVDDLAGVTGEGTEERTVTVHDDETETGVRLEELSKSLGVELVVAKVEGGVDGLQAKKM